MARREKRNDAGVPDSQVPSAADDIAPSDDALPEARVVAKGTPADETRWIRRGVFFGVLVVGWLFIAWANRFYWTAPLIISCIGFFAVCSTVYALWRVGATAVAPDDEEGADSTWGRPIGARGELEREKRTLLKAIKEAEFDREMGKLSKKDADEMIAVYRLRAIEVIKELDKLEDLVGAPALSKRQEIEREIKARVELDKTTAKANKKSKKQRDPATQKVLDDAAKVLTGDPNATAAVAEIEDEPEHAAHDSTVAPDEPEAKEAAR
ncbi:MAG TPA: hypothetical protein VGM90_21235 [Kofleriaceae bacterium]|jgi:hypothetical protein